MAKLDEELVAAFIVEKFNVTQAEAWEFIDSVKAQEKIDKEAKEASGERKKKEYVILIADPEGKLNVEDYTGYIIEKLPTSLKEDPSNIDDVSTERSWGDLESESFINAIKSTASSKYSKKGPFSCMGDLLSYLPNKVFKSAGMKVVSKNPISLIPISTKFEEESLELTDNIEFLK